MKNVTDIFIHRPVLSSAISLFIFVCGIVAFQHLSLRLFPKVVSPIITINTVYPGANSQIMNNDVTAVIQNALSGIDGVNYMTASSSQNHSEITLNMMMGYSPEQALSAVLSKIASISSLLPRDAEQPMVTASSSDSDPAMILAVTSKQLDRRDVADYLRHTLKPALESVEGVSEAQVLGHTSAMRLWLNPIKMAARGVTAKAVSDAIQHDNVMTAAGKTEGKETDESIQATTDMQTADDFNHVLIKSHNGAYVQLKDIGYAALGDRSNDISAFYQSEAAALIFIKLLPGANPVTVIDQVKTLLQTLHAPLPFDMTIHTVVDNGRYIHEAMDEVIKTLLLATLIVVIVIYACLGSLRSMLIPVITIPLSLLGTCIFLEWLGFTINTLTLLAMVMAIGLVVDDAIVVVENVYRYLEKSMPAKQAALIGAREMIAPVIGMSITLAAVYVPIGLASGLTGQLFKEFAFTLSVAVILSGVMALTLVPMLCSRLEDEAIHKPRLTEKIAHYQMILREAYHQLLRWILPRYQGCIAVWCVLVLVMMGLLYTLPKELAPAEDQGLLLAISSAPDYTNSHFLGRYSLEFMNKLPHFSNSDSAVTVTGIPTTHQALSFVSLKEWGVRHQTAMQLKPLLQQMANQVPGLQTIIVNPASLPGESDIPLQIVLKSTESYEKLFAIANQIVSTAWDSGLFEFVQTDLHYDQPALKIDFNRNAAMVLGITMQQISEAFSLLLGGNQIQQYTHDNQRYFVIPQLEERYRTNARVLSLLHFSTPSGKQVPLSSIATITTTAEPEHLNQFQKQNAITIRGEMVPGHSLFEGVKFFQKTIKTMQAPSILLDYAGQTRQFIAEGHRLIMLFCAAIFVIFIVLAIQFECYRSPLIILLGSVPLTMVAALLPLSCGMGTLNIYTEIGLLTLVGLISKQGILMTAFAHHLQRSGLSKAEAIIKAACLRLRPILMTTAAMVLGVLPLMVLSGAGSVSRNELGVVIACGMLVGAALTLVFLPVFYVLWAPTLSEKDNAYC